MNLQKKGGEGLDMHSTCEKLEFPMCWEKNLTISRELKRFCGTDCRREYCIEGKLLKIQLMTSFFG